MTIKKMDDLKKRSENLKRAVASVKRNNLLQLSLFVLVLMLVSCGRCQECTFDARSPETICETEFDTPEQYEQAIDQAEADNGTCASTGGL